MEHVQHITSRQNRRIKDAAKLRDRRQRERQGRFLIDGVREIGRAVDADIEIVEAYVCDELVATDQARRTVERSWDAATLPATVSAEVYDKLCFGERRDGVVVVAATPRRSLEHIQLPANPLIVVLEGLEKPGNVGAVLRSADGAGVDAVIVVEPRTDLFNPNTIRASLGAVFGENICTTSGEDASRWLRQRKLPIAAAQPGGAMHYDAFDYRRGAAIVLGSEADGLSELWRGDDVTAVSLPMRGIADSLNVSATAAVMVYEAQRQRRIG